MSGAVITCRNNNLSSKYQERFQHSNLSIITSPAITEVKSFVSSSSNISAEEFTTAKTTTKEMWRCDYCNKAKFHTYQEAERHEEICKKVQYQALVSARDTLESFKTNNLNDDEDYEMILNVLLKLDDLYCIISRDSLESTRIGRVVATLKKCNYDSIAMKAKYLVKAWKRKIKGKHGESGEEIKTMDLSNKMNPEQNDNLSIEQRLRKRQKKKEETVPTAPIFQRGKLITSADSTTMSSKTVENSHRAKKTTNKAGMKTKPLASIFAKQPSKSIVKRAISSTKVEASTLGGTANHPTTESKYAEAEDLCTLDNEEMLSEHRKAEFLIERRRAEEKRRKKRNVKRSTNDVKSDSRPAVARIFQPVSKINNVRNMRKENQTQEVNEKIESDDFREHTMRSMDLEKRKEIASKKEDTILDLRNSAPKFPSPNHVIGGNGDVTEFEESQMNSFPQVRDMLICSPKYQCGVDNVSDNMQTCDPMGSLFGNSKHDFPPPSFDPIHSSFSSVVRPTNDEIKSISNDSSGPRLWAEKYTMNSVPHDIYGKENKLAAEDLLSFINEWKVNRQQAIIAAEQAHLRRSKKKTKQTSSRKRRYDNYDEDFLSDSEDEDGLSKVYILCGPVGCGKTSLVYAAAKKSHCAVLEMNTTDDRGGVSLKKTIEECTQSHSSLALMKQKNTFVGSETDLQDTDDEGDSKTSLALILIDEVDLLFDSDVGFWQSLGNLAKKAKCPIILTATQPPPQLLNSTTILYRYAYLSLPSPMECASKMCQIAKMENMMWQDGLKDREIKEGLATIAKMCRCDLRKIMNEMQLYNKGSVCKEKKILNNEIKPKQSSVKPNKNYPSVNSVSPNKLSSSTHTVLQITGKHFFSSTAFLGTDVSVKVTVGEQQCPATKIIDDNNIFAVCPPCQIPTHVTQYGIVKKTHQRSLDCIHQPVKVQLTAANRVFYTVDSLLSDNSLSPTLRYDFPEEGNDNTLEQHEQDCDSNTVTEMLKDAVDKYTTLNDHSMGGIVSETSSLFVEPPQKSLTDDIEEMNNLMRVVMDASDAAILEESLGMMSAPLLTGAVHRCGEMVDNCRVFSRDMSRNHDQFQGCPNMYMTKPVSKRDRFLFSTTCEFSRGNTSFHPELSTSGTSSNICLISNDDDENYCMFTDCVACSISEEDLFMTSPVSSCAAMVPYLIRNSNQFKGEHFRELNYDGKLQLLNNERETQRDKTLNSVDSILTEGKLPCTNSYFNETMRSSFSLDYIPALRNIAMIERIADQSFEKLRLTSNEEIFSSHSRRRTRRSGPIVREHYFNNLVGKHSECEPKDIGESFANMRLITN